MSMPENTKMKKAKEILSWLFAAGCAVGIAVSLWNIFFIRSTYEAGEKAYSSMAQYVSEVPKTAKPVQPDASGGQADSPYRNVEFPDVDFDSLREINPEIVGWIQIEDTNINYPIAQSEDNEYYLNHMFTREGNGSGGIFLDCRNRHDFSGRNNILYGHNMKNGSMFHNLSYYKEQAFYDAHPTYLLMTPEHNYVVEIFAVYPLSVYEDGWKLQFESDAEYAAWLEGCIAHSMVATKVEPQTTDRVLTLSTCTYEFNNARLLVNGILHEVG